MTASFLFAAGVLFFACYWAGVIVTWFLYVRPLARERKGQSDEALDAMPRERRRLQPHVRHFCDWINAT